MALRAAGKAELNYRLPEVTLYVTLEPCVMCVGAIMHARIKRVVFGADDPRAGAAGSAFSLLGSDVFNHSLVISGGVLADECGEMLRKFFKARR
jgi:tRNA(adenine34) deaminase